MRIACLALPLLLVATSVHAQSLNIDFGPATDAPSAAYGAAGLPGAWNAIEGEDSPMITYHLLGLDGAPTGATLYNIGGTELMIAHDASVSGDDAALMNDALVTYTSSLETCLFINGLEPGTYEVTMYAWMPSAPAQRARVRHDLDSRTEDVGGAWPGAHVEGVTYARHMLVIGSSGFMGSHCGIVPGMDELNGAALNGLQLRKLDCAGAPCPDAGVPPSDAGTPPSDAGAQDLGAPPDAGVPPSDAGTTSDAGTPPHDAGASMDAGGSTHSGGCACSATGGATHSAAATAVLLALALVARTRRRR